jgi:hypothetical protein
MTDRQNAGGGHRLFFALWPQDGVRAALAQAADRMAALEGRRIADA